MQTDRINTRAMDFFLGCGNEASLGILSYEIPTISTSLSFVLD
jgi:hypothetical protein